jgi:hypothetical protein
MPVSRPILKNTAFYNPHFGLPPGAKFIRFPILLFDLGAATVSPPNFSVLPHLEVEKHANFHIYWVHHLVSFNSGFIIMFRELENPNNDFI